MNSPNMFDLLLIAIALASGLSACHRGLGRETLHTFLFAATAIAGWLFLIDREPPGTKEEVAYVLVNLGYYTLTAYLLTWALLKFGAPLIMAEEEAGIRSKFWAGIMAFAKIGCTLLALNLWFAVYSLDAYPMRQQVLPRVLQESVILRLSDDVTEKIYKFLASKGILEYQKYLMREKPVDSGTTKTYKELIGVPKQQ